jgi:CRP-like cAMP-binding protein
MTTPQDTGTEIAPEAQRSAQLSQPPRNRLLAALPPAELEAMTPFLRPVTLPIRSPLYDADAPIEHVDFIESGVASIVEKMKDGTVVEVMTIGPEGFVGLPVFLGTDRTPSQAFMQVAGSALRMPAQDFVRFAAHPALHETILRYIQATFVLLAQSSACNRIHDIAQRCARWLLLTRDRVESDSIGLTQEFLAQMLGVRRASVNGVMVALQNEGLLSYSRGNLTLLDRPRLEEKACECYRVIRGEFDRMLGGFEAARREHEH